ncbi:MAG: HNH endonuclease [Marinobacter sp.]|nr:HNH endonuclease [Marinobacter sp.]
MELTQEFVRQIFDYNPKTGALHWTPTGCRTMAGRRAGYVNRSQKDDYVYRVVQIRGKVFLEHRVIWLHVHGNPLPSQIDHKNRNATDNRIENMRDGTGINNYNFSLSTRNTTGAMGVTRNKQSGKYQASVKVRGKSHYLGLYENLEDAAEAARAYREKMGFDPGHGTSLAHYHADKVTSE